MVYVLKPPASDRQKYKEIARPIRLYAGEAFRSDGNRLQIPAEDRRQGPAGNQSRYIGEDRERIRSETARIAD